MFDFVRKHTKIMQFVLFLLIFPSFVLFGLEGYNRMRQKGETVARVDGRDITQDEWDQAHKQEVDRLRQSMPSLDPKLLDSPEAKYATLERMVSERVLAAAAVGEKLSVSDQRLARELSRNEVIAQLRGPDGKLDMARYRQLLANQGMTPEMFESGMRAELAQRQVLGGITGSAPRIGAPMEVAMGAFYERRSVQVANFATNDYAGKVNLTDADIEAFYKANPQMFQAPEQAGIEYVVLDADAVKKGITISDADLKAYYDQNAARLAGQEERRASHILLAAPKGAPAAEREKAKARAEELLAQVRKSPASFADVAKKNSQDPGSAPQGGDLDFFARGAMTKPFEDAVFALKKGEISNVVESDFGFHIIQLTDIKAPKQRTFEELKPEIEAELKKQQAQKKFAETAEAFTNGGYEQADSLKPVADRLKLEIRKAEGVTRKPAEGATGPLANPKFLAALFAPDAVERKRNTEAVETGANTLVSGRITQYTPARTRPLAEVKEDVRKRLLAQKGAELARKDGMDKLAAWKAAPDSAQLGAPITISREESQKQPRPVIEAALRADPAALPQFVGVDLGADGYTIVRVGSVLPRTAPQGSALQDQQMTYLRGWTGAEAVAYYNLLKERFKAQIKVPKPAPALEATQ